MRKLASIQKIKSLSPIADADAIVKALVLGWEVVVKKGEFSEGDWCVYCEIDSLFPDKPEFEFLRSRGMRIRTVRLRGQISQGICFPLNVLPEGIEPEEGLDVTEMLGIVKYEPPIPASLAGLVKGDFPSFIPKTDETRVQVLQELLDQYKGIPCYVTEKLDGSSVTYYYRNEEFGVCSRNLELLDSPENTLWKVARESQIEEKLKEAGLNIALQGELIGEGIQRNKYKLRGQRVCFFNAFDIDKYRYLHYEDFANLILGLGLQQVPLLEQNWPLENDIPKLIEKSKRKSVLKTDVWAEGIVFRPMEEIYDPKFRRVSFKAINPEFLLKFDE